MAQHVCHHGGVMRVCATRDFVMVGTRFSEETVLVVEDDVVVITMSARNNDSLSNIVAGGILFGIRCYYRGPDVGALTCTVRQIQVLTSHTDDQYVEEYHMGVVPAMIASRERILVAPYTPHIVPRCVDTSPTGLQTPLVLTDTGRDLTRRLANYGIRDVPWVTKPVKEITLGGPPTCVLRVRFTRVETPVGSVFGD